VGISFKGSGFYATDYKGAASKAETTKNGESEEKAASSDKGAQKSNPSTEKAASKQD
jgi:predicted nucleic acid-binding Zn ribbon protein